MTVLVRRLQAFKKLASPAPSQGRYIHHSRPNENIILVSGISLMTAAFVGQYALKAYQNYQLNRPQEPASAPEPEEVKSNPSSSNVNKGSAKQSTEAASNSFNFSFGSSSWFARNFYDGGFEEKMTKREASLILGVRESASIDRIKDAHRKILLLNHPDRGGSAYIAAKINEAKDLLLKGKQ